MQIKDLSIDEFTRLFKGLIRETIEEILQEMLVDPEVNGTEAYLVITP